MADVVSVDVRSRMMSGIRGKNTRIEVDLRKALFAMGFRYRLHVRTLPGKPDVVLPKHAAAIFIHGCFWHGHDCELFRLPKSNTDFWRTKIERNRKVDIHSLEELHLLQWRVLTIWECSLRGRSQLGLESVAQHAKLWIESGPNSSDIRGSN